MGGSRVQVLIAILMTAFLQQCNLQAASGPVKTPGNNSKHQGEGHPQKKVEIIKLMVSERSDVVNNKKNLEIERVPQKETPNYEILITPNKQDPEGSQKIKIYVEASSTNENEKVENVKRRLEEPQNRQQKQNIFDVLPLSIESQRGSNIEYSQQATTTSVKHGSRNYGDDVNTRDFDSYPSKRQTEWTTVQKPRTESQIFNRSPETKGIVTQGEPSYVDQNNPYFPVTSSKVDGRRGSPVYNSDYSSVAESGKRIPQETYVEDYSESGRSSRRPAHTLPVEQQFPRNYDTLYQEESIYEATPSNERRPIIREPEDAPQRRPLGQREQRPETDDYLLSGSRSSSYPRSPEMSRPTYDIEEPENSNSGASGSCCSPEHPDRYPDYERSPLDNRPQYVRRPEERPMYQSTDAYRETYVAPSSRPVRENNSGYSGFPESYQPDISHHYSRPLQYEPARAFPASPCLSVFKYEGREPEEDRWYADVYVTTDEVLNGMRLDITLDRPAELLTVSTNWMADVRTKDNVHFTLLSLTHKLVPGPAETVRIMVKFNGKKPVPYLKSINLNGRLICPAQKTTTRKPVYENPGDLQIRKTTEQYIEPSKRPLTYIDDYESNTKRTTAHIDRRTTPPYEDARKPTPRPPSQFLKPNPNGYEETDQNSFSGPPGLKKKPHGRPSHSNGKPPPHAAKPAQGVSQTSTHGQAHNHAQVQGSQLSTNKGGNKHQGSAIAPANLENRIECGTPSIQPSPLITHGQDTSRGQWPWHVALYKNVGTDLTFFCGGSLINTRYVLTAAHCVTKTYTTKPLDENSLVVYLGKYHLKLWSEGGVQNRQVSKIYVHSKYNSTDFRSDIALLALSTPVEYTDYVRPICMWDRSNTRIEDVEGKLGTVVGWGFDEDKMLTEELRQAKMPVVEQKTCLWSYPDFYPQFTSNMTYCAGFKNGTSVCNGDSGGGMVFPFKDRNGVERWYLRGIVSISPARNDSRVCDTSHYVVFTDVAKYLPWLENFV